MTTERVETRDAPVATSASVLLTFRGENVRSFRSPFELSMVATTIAEPAVRRKVAWREGGTPIDVLPVAGIFGGNASGKTNVLRALADMRSFVIHSFRHGRPGGGLPQKPFRLDAESPDQPSRFEIDLVLCGVRHSYGFAVDRDAVREEWCFRYPKGRAAMVFERDGDHVELGRDERPKGRAVRELLRPNALFLSTAASAAHPILLPLYTWFERNLWIAEAQSRESRQALTVQMLQNPELGEQVLAFVQAADLGITGAAARAIDPDMRERLERAVRVLVGEEGAADSDASPLPAFDEMYGVELTHRGAAGQIAFDPTEESLGTLVWFGLVGPVLQALREGSVFLADELDASLHPVLVAHLVELFQSPSTNPHRAQLIFNSHDTTVLGGSAAERGRDLGIPTRLLGRDQIWFTEKANDGATRLYPLSDLDPRKDEAIERRYLAGRYGGLPLVSRPQLAAVAHLATNGSSGER